MKGLVVNNVDFAGGEGFIVRYNGLPIEFGGNAKMMGRDHEARENWKYFQKTLSPGKFGQLQEATEHRRLFGIFTNIKGVKEVKVNP